MMDNEYNAPMPTRPRRSIWRVFFAIVLVLSVLANVFMLLAIVGMAAMMTTSKPGDDLLEKTRIDGARHEKIAVVRIEGIIDGSMSDWVEAQLAAAERDPAVRAVIVNIISPGGGVAASDRIHYAITRYKKDTGQPVLAFMQSIAASGGYYAAVACDTIMAEPTTITGSIGVMMNHMVVKELFEEKLGIRPVVITSGQRKDWPSIFSETTDEQRQYLDERIIQPAYERFVQRVIEGRSEKLSAEQVYELADGAIFTAPYALNEKLIDNVGYLDQAVAMLSDTAGLHNPTVVEYNERFGFWSLLGAEVTAGGLKIDADVLEKFLVPQVMYLWDGRR